MSARLLIVFFMILNIAYSAVLSFVADKQRKKPLPDSVSDVYDQARYQKFLAYKTDYRRLRYLFQLFSLMVEIPLLFSAIYPAIEQFCKENPYLISLLTYAVYMIPETILSGISSWISTFRIETRYGMNRKDGREFTKDFCIEKFLEILIVVLLTLFFTFIGEHMDKWTNHFSVDFVKAAGIACILLTVIFLIICIVKLISYKALRLQYHFTLMPEGPLLEKIRKLQEGSKKKVRAVYIYNESKKSTSKNAFLLKLFWHREFGIADNFMNENEERELLAVLSHEIGHLKHKRNWRNYLAYLSFVLLFLLVVCSIAFPFPILQFVDWVNHSFDITVINYTMIITVLSSLTGPLSLLFGFFHNSRSRAEEYEADREAVKNGYGRELIATFKRLSNDELVDVNPHPLIETLEYDHPGMANRIAAIEREMTSQSSRNNIRQMNLG